MVKLTSHSRAFFLELVINLLMFSLCAAVCLHIFAYAHLKSERSRELSQASLKAQTVAEVFKAEGGDIYRVAELCGGGANGDYALIYYDAGWAPVSETDAAYTLRCEAGPDGLLKSARITAYNGDAEIFSITANARAGKS